MAGTFDRWIEDAGSAAGNGEWAGNWTSDDPCSWGDTCSWDGFYTSDFTISFDWDGSESNPAP